MNNVLVKRVKNYLLDHNKPLTPENFQDNLQEVLGFQGEKLKNSKAEMEFVNGISLAKAKELYERDLPIHSHYIPIQVHVPLYQYEYDTLVDLCFNGGGGALQSNYSGVAEVLNHGLYSEVSVKILGYKFGRRPKMKDLWHNKYDIEKPRISSVPLGKKIEDTPWEAPSKGADK